MTSGSCLEALGQIEDVILPSPGVLFADELQKVESRCHPLCSAAVCHRCIATVTSPESRLLVFRINSLNVI